MSLELRLWKFGEDDKFIDSYLKSCSSAHKNQFRSDFKNTEWFHWKFQESPYGNAILACAFDGDILAGCVAMGMGKITYGEKVLKCALSYDTYVNPQYQGKGLFKKLITLVNEECKKAGVDLIYNFPNNNSLRGFIRLGYTQIENHSQYLLRPVKFFSFLSKLKDLKKSFSPEESNLEELKNINIPDLPEVKQDCVFIPQWTKDYLRWRFLTYPISKYYIYDKNNVWGIIRIGRRGRLNEAQVLYIQRCDGKEVDKHDLSLFEKVVKKDISPDFISYNISKNNKLSGLLRNRAIKVPSRAHFTFKILSDNLGEIRPEDFKISLNNIDAHTY